MIDTDKDYKNRYLFVDDLIEIGEPIPEEILKSMPPIKVKVISGTLGTFNIKDFGRITGGLKDV